MTDADLQKLQDFRAWLKYTLNEFNTVKQGIPPKIASLNTGDLVVAINRALAASWPNIGFSVKADIYWSGRKYHCRFYQSRLRPVAGIPVAGIFEQVFFLNSELNINFDGRDAAGKEWVTTFEALNVLAARRDEEQRPKRKNIDAWNFDDIIK